MKVKVIHINFVGKLYIMDTFGTTHCTEQGYQNLGNQIGDGFSLFSGILNINCCNQTKTNSKEVCILAIH